MTSEAVALIDMDGTLADYDGQMRQDLLPVMNPAEVFPALGPNDDLPHIEARKNLIKRQPGWWRKLPKLADGFHILDVLRALDFRLMILTKGPYSTTAAWTEKVEWCREHVPDAQVSIVEDKGLVYGKVLVDDWPPYIIRWLEWRPRGLVVMPDRPWNQGFKHPNVLRYRGQEDEDDLRIQLDLIRRTVS